MSLMKKVRASPMAKFAGTAGVMIAARIAGSLLTMLYMFLLTDVAPPEEVGAAFAALSMGMVLSVAGSLNVEAGSIRFLPLYLEQGRTAEAAGFVKAGSYTVYAASAVILAIGVPYVAMTSDRAGIDPYLISLLIVPLIASARINGRHATALGYVLRGALPRMLVRPLLFTTVLLICIAGDISLDATQVMAIFLSATLLVTIVQWFLIRHAIAFSKHPDPSFAGYGEWIILGLVLVPVLLMGEYMRDLVIVSANLVLPSAEIAKLGISISLVGALSFGLTAVDMTLSPQIARSLVRDERRRTSRLLTLCAAMKLVMFCIGAPLLYLLIPYAIGMMGEAYVGLRQYFLILLVIPLSAAVFGPANLVLNVLGRRRELMTSAFFGLPLLTVAVGLAGHAYGLIGVMIATSGAMAVYVSVQSAICRRILRMDTTLLSYPIFLHSQRG